MANTFKTLLGNDVTNTRTLLHEAIPITGTNTDVKFIDSIVRVTGRTTGYAIDIPVRFAKV